MALWLPATGRTGKFRGTGNGGLGGGAGVNAAPLAAGVRAGFGTAGNNTARGVELRAAFPGGLRPIAVTGNSYANTPG